MFPLLLSGGGCSKYKFSHEAVKGLSNNPR